MIQIINIKTVLVAPRSHAFVNLSLQNGFHFSFTKLFANIKIRVFNKKFLALLLSGFVILCIRYIFNYCNYVINISLLFIIFCGFLKSIILVIIEYLDEINLFKSRAKNRRLSKYYFNDTFNSYNHLDNNNGIVNDKGKNINYNNTNLYDIHIPITLERLKNATSLEEVDSFFRVIYKQEIIRHNSKLKELVYEAVLTEKIQQELIRKIEEEQAIFRERLFIIEEDRCIHVVFLRVKKGLKY